MTYVSKPCAYLAPYIENCWSVFSEGKSGVSFYEIFPDCNVKLIFRFSSTACRMVLMGPATEKATVEIAAAPDYFGFRFRPGQAPQLADVHPSKLVNSFVDIFQIQGEPIQSLAKRLLSLKQHPERQLLMERIIRDSLPNVPDRRCRQATILLDLHGGQLSIKNLAGKLGIQVRSLERLFKSRLGLSPKRLNCLIRLRRIMSHLHAGTFTSLAELAQTCGYADQSHMTREFKEMTGRLPGQKGACEPRPLTGSPCTRIIHRYRR